MIIQFSCKNCVKSFSLWLHSKKIALTIWLSSFAMHILFWALTLTQGIRVKKKKKDFRPTDRPDLKMLSPKGQHNNFFYLALASYCCLILTACTSNVSTVMSYAVMLRLSNTCNITSHIQSVAFHIGKSYICTPSYFYHKISLIMLLIKFPFLI